MATYIIIGITLLVSISCFGRDDLAGKLSLCPYAMVRRGEWYRIVTHAFVHADWTHLLVNMFTFWSFGTHMETLYAYAGFGLWGYLLLYFGGMIFASLYDITKQYDNPYYQSIGASGAVSAVLFSSIFFNPWGKIYFFAILPIPGIVFGALYLYYCHYMSRRMDSRINHTAHFAGAVFGFVLPAVLNPQLIGYFLNALLMR